MKAHGRMAVRFQYIIHHSQQELSQKSQWCHVKRPAHAHPANKRPEEPQACCIWDQKHQRALYQKSFSQHDRSSLPCMGCCFQSFGIVHDASHKRYFHPPKCARRVSHQALRQDTKSGAARAAPTQPIGFPAYCPACAALQQPHCLRNITLRG